MKFITDLIFLAISLKTVELFFREFRFFLRELIVFYLKTKALNIRAIILGATDFVEHGDVEYV